MLRLLSLAAIAIMASTVSSASHAATVMFNIYGGPVHIRFAADQSPIPSQYDDYSFVLGLPIKFNGDSEFATIIFERGGIFITSQTTAGFDVSPEIFTGPPSSPTFVTGRFNLDGWVDEYGNPRYPRPFSMIVSRAGPVPEPATWTLMLTGFGAIGFAMRQRKPYNLTKSHYDMQSPCSVMDIA